MARNDYDQGFRGDRGDYGDARRGPSAEDDMRRGREWGDEDRRRVMSEWRGTERGGMGGRGDWGGGPMRGMDDDRWGGSGRGIFRREDDDESMRGMHDDERMGMRRGMGGIGTGGYAVYGRSMGERSGYGGSGGYGGQSGYGGQGGMRGMGGAGGGRLDRGLGGGMGWDYGREYGERSSGSSGHGGAFGGSYGRSERGGYGRRDSNDWSVARGGYDRDDRGERDEGFFSRMGREVSELGSRVGDMIEGAFSRKGPKGYKRSDDRIREDVCEALADDPYLDASEIEVRVQNAEVTLTGTVGDRASKRRAELLLDHVRGLDEVHNQLRIRRETTTPQQGAGATTGMVQPRTSH